MILIINAGSSSIKFQLYEVKNTQFIVKCKGLAERVGIDGIITIEYSNKKETIKDTLPDHDLTAEKILQLLQAKKIINNFNDISGVGHRIVHGSTAITKSVIVDNNVINIIKNCIKLAPLHNPAGLSALKAFQHVIKAPHVAVFDTTFHTTMPKINCIYPIPQEWTKKHDVRRYGFHGISYQYVTQHLATILKKNINEVNAIICHLGNGASICAVKNGKSYNTSMGFTPLAGVMMGTRSGDIDPSIHEYIAKELNQTIETITTILNKQSGLLGVSNISSDAREVIKNKDLNKDAQFALELYAKRVADYIVQYQNDLENKVDALVFTAGVGENSSLIRQMIIDKVKTVNLKIDETKNNQSYDDYLIFSNDNSEWKVIKIRTNEELMICQDTLNLIKNK